MGQQDRPARRSWQAPDDRTGRGYRGQPARHGGSQPLAPPAQRGWGEAASPDEYPSAAGYPLSYRDSGYGRGGHSDPRTGTPGRHPPAAPGPRRSARVSSGRGKRRAVVGIAGLVLGFIGGATYLLLGGQSSGRPTAQGGTSAPSHSAPPAVTHRGDLRKYLIAAPGGSRPWPHPLGTHQKLSLRQAAILGSNHKARRSTLMQDHFTRGAVKCWITSHGTWVDVRLYQFGTAAAAQDFLRGDIEASSRITPAADQYRVSGVPGARAFADPKPDSTGYIGILVIGVKGDVVFLVDIAEHANTAHLTLPDMLMRRQHGKL